MREWKKKVTSVGLSASLLAGLVLAPVNALAEPPAKSQLSKYTASAVSVNQPWLQQKIDEMQKSPYSEDTLIVHYQRPLTPAEHQRMGAVLIHQISDLNYAVVRVHDKKKFNTVLNNYQKLDSVVSVNPSLIYKSYGFTDPKVGEQYHLSQLNIEKALKLAGKNKVKVAVVDTGIDMRHSELKGQLLPSYNTVSPMNPGAPDAHGTHVAGIIAGKKDNGIGGYGINPNATIIPIDVFDRGWGAYDYAIAQGILQAVKSGAKVINLSLGSPLPSPLIEAAIKKAIAQNITVIAAAGNDGSDWTNYPAGYEGVISVGSTNKDKKLSEYSSYGPSVDVVAPGEEVYSSIYEPEKLSSFRKMSGTSMASPVVAGVASLLLSKYPNLTPAQVEYILEHTADDLGAKGYDVKYGNGLVDPVAALQFDMKKLPKISQKSLTDKEIIAQAKQIDVSKPVVKTDTITNPFQVNWVKFDVQKDEYIQAVLEGAHLYDYKMTVQFFSNDGKKVEEINDVREGRAEGKLLKAPFTGTVVIGVKDANGSYDDSGKNLSQYSLSIEKLTELPADDSTLEAPIDVKTLPFETKDVALTFTGEEGDDDYLKFSVEEKQVIKIDTSAVAGVNSSISVYTADMLVPPPSQEEEKVTAAHEIKEEEQIPPLFTINSKGKGEGETLTFIAEPKMEYIVKVTNKSNNYYGMYDFYMGYGNFNITEKAESSAIPYSVMIEGKVLPADEDNYPMMEEMPGEPTKEVTEKATSNKLSIFQAAHDPWAEEILPQIQAAARPHEIGKTSNGYLQQMGDEDWFTVTPTQTGIYEFSLNNGINLPMMEIYQLTKQKDPNGNEFSYFNPIGTNMNYSWSSMTMNQKLYTGLKAGETYYMKLNASWFNNQISFDEYKFTSKLLIKNPQDKYENNNELEKVKNLPGLVFEGNFALPNDQDVFYLQSKSEQLYGVKMERGALNAQMKKYPKEIVSPFYGFITIYEDTNKNRKVDDSENSSVQFIQKGAYSGNTFGSFIAEKGKNYILAISGYTDGFIPLTLMPYKVTIASVNKKDEDAGNKVVNNKPTKPINLKKVKSNLWETTGDFNSGVGFGDEDWYTFTLDRNTSGVIKLEAPLEVDGKIELYQNGKLISSADYYPEGDAEVLSVSLKKGTYQIKVKDYFGNATLSPYKLKVYMK